MSKRASSAAIIAATFSSDARDVAEYRYQPTRTPFPIYAIGESYYAVSATRPAPTSMDFEWREHSDQFFASRAGTVLWIAAAVTSKGK